MLISKLIQQVRSKKTMFKKVLIVNRGEIAVRIIRALREMNIESVAIYSDADKDSLHAIKADYAYPLNGNRAVDTYLDIDKIVRIAKDAGVDAIHPGYGFLAENQEFAARLEKEGIVFIGPSSQVIGLMGNKIVSRRTVSNLGIPTIPGTDGIVADKDTAHRAAAEIGFPVLVKAAAGGGGVGMRVVHMPKEMENTLEMATKQAMSAFGDGTIFIEKYIEKPRHIEVQIVADNYGNVVHLGERECSIQRRYQKIIEESLSLAISKEMRAKMGEMAVKIARNVNYRGVGTVEFIYDNGNVYFLEMNTRVQVEHPVTEFITGIDIIKTQIQIAAGQPLSFTQHDIIFNGHAIECRICAEDPLNSFCPSPNTIEKYHEPGGAGVRVDSGVYENYEVTVYYDSMISKLITWGRDREEAIARMKRALHEYIIEGPKTNIPYLKAALASGEFSRGELSTKFVEENTYLFDDAKRLAVQQLGSQRLPYPLMA